MGQERERILHPEDLTTRVAVLVAAGAIGSHLLKLEAIGPHISREHVRELKVSHRAKVHRALLRCVLAAFPERAWYLDLCADELERLLEQRELRQFRLPLRRPLGLFAFSF